MIDLLEAFDCVFGEGGTLILADTDNPETALVRVCSHGQVARLAAAPADRKFHGCSSSSR